MIRKFNRRDLKRVMEIESLSFPGSAYDRFTLLYLSNFYRFLVYCNGEELVGYIIYDPKSGHILSLAVDPSHRREGVGARLVERVFEDCERAWVEVRRGNRAAQNFYLKLGFRLAGEIRRYYGDEDAFVMAIEKFNSGTTMQ